MGPVPLELLLDEIPNVSEGKEQSRVPVLLQDTAKNPGKAAFLAAVLHGSTASTGVGQSDFLELWKKLFGSCKARGKQSLSGLLCVLYPAACGPFCAERNPALLRDGELTSEKRV